MKKSEFGKAFSFLNASIIPTKAVNLSPEDLIKIDEYGFRKPVYEATETEKNILDSAELRYNKSKDKWIKFLEEKYQKLATRSCSEIIKFDPHIIDDETRIFLVKLLETDSIPNDLRPFFWVRLSNALSFKNEHELTFLTLLQNIAQRSNSTLTSKQLSQINPGNVCFEERNETLLTRIQNCLGILNKELQKQKNSTNSPILEEIQEWNFTMICSHLLLLCNEEDCCWILLKLASLPVVHFCIDLVEQLISTSCPLVAELIKEHELDLSHILQEWFSTLFISQFNNCHILFMLWDMFFAEGPIFLVQFTLGLFIVESQNLLSTLKDTDSANVFNTLSELPANILVKIFFKSDDDNEQKDDENNDNDHKKESWWDIQENIVNKIRLICKTGKNVTNQVSNISKLLFNYSHEYPDQNFDINQAKHFKQTTLMNRLHDAIIAIKDHFQAYNPDIRYRIDLNLDNNHLDGVNESEKGKMDNNLGDRLKSYRNKRAKALMSFTTETGDELEFRSNDIITILNQQDEHCWIGELDNRIGWFPAKLVELLDERDQEYSIAGDDRCIPFINILVRGRLCSILKAIIANDMKKPAIFIPGTSYATHPWSLFEELSDQLRDQSDFRVVYSRLVLNCTFHLDEYSRILKPIELLYRSMAAINKTHTDSPMDVKFRSLICMGLNQYCLHEWFELLAKAADMDLSKYFDKDSILRTPVWRLIQAELKLLVQFSFHLNPNSELDSMNLDFGANFNNYQAIDSKITKESVCDMLVKYHLFSWDSV